MMVASATKCYMVLLVVGLLLVSQSASARKLLASSQDGEPSTTVLKVEHAPAGTNKDEKNFIAYGGMGHYSGIGGFIGMGGLPIMPGGSIGGVGGIGKVGGLGGLVGVGGGIAKGGAIGGGVGGGIAKGGAIGGGVGGGVLPHP